MSHPEFTDVDDVELQELRREDEEAHRLDELGSQFQDWLRNQ